MENVMGKVHSIESFSAVDGPGIRVVVFLQGCFLRCIYCHNPDTWDVNGGKKMSAEDVAKKVLEYENYITKGGVTLSGGEPLLQTEFALNLLKILKEKNLHTACETAASLPLKRVKDVLKYIDLVILDLKSIDEESCKKICRLDVNSSLDLLNYCEKTKKDVWVRHVIVPQYTLNFEKLKEMAVFLKKFSVIKKAKLLAFHKMGEYKWKELNFEYDLYDLRVPTQKEIDLAVKIFRDEGLLIV